MLLFAHCIALHPVLSSVPAHLSMHRLAPAQQPATTPPLALPPATPLGMSPQRLPQWIATATALLVAPSDLDVLTPHDDCGQQGHISSQCGMEAQPKTCYKCNETGHISRDCPSNPAPSSGGAGGECYKCGQHGHIARACPTGGNAGGAFGGSRGGRSCYNCGGFGHLSRDCTSAPSGGSGAGYGGQRCYNCNETGHLSRDCPKPQTKSCYRCGAEDHLSAACPTAA
ncbi:zinc knuckle domain protein [Moesziomyces antarcticus]|uniref:zinc knuckle domain protein n=1 Tax=Pseudozyma antarctica TaxID=84753 RepID=UPI0007197E39|nr:zinc knuckle domain protein [Moesziomyces antarcticus]GAK62729.1 zinc knuckle domain protein [Moesziomyces antarcticus]